MKSIGSNRRGVALIIVLLMVSIIVALTIQFNRDTRSEVYGAANVSDGIRLRYIAESGFYVGEALLLADKNVVRRPDGVVGQYRDDRPEIRGILR